MVLVESYIVTPAERQYARNRATNTRAMGHTVTNEHALAADVLALDNALSEAEEEIRRLNHEAAALEAEARSLRAALAAAETTT
jgi:septal ring factor EnvC (AmiA/AmiB activator)